MQKVCDRVGCTTKPNHTVILYGVAGGEVPLCEAHADEAIKDEDGFAKTPLATEMEEL